MAPHKSLCRRNKARPTPTMVWERRKRLAKYNTLLPRILSRIEALGLSNEDLEKLVTEPREALLGKSIRDCLVPKHIVRLDRYTQTEYNIV